jgi:hypothetical protein
VFARVTVSSTKTLPAERHPFEKVALRLPVGSLEDLALGRVVPEQLLDQVHVREQHATAAVAGESQFAQRFSVNNNNILKSVKARQFQFPLIHCRFVFLSWAGYHVPLSHALRTVRLDLDQLDIFGPEVADDLFAKVVSFLGRGVGWGFGSCLPCRRRSSARG